MPLCGDAQQLGVWRAQGTTKFIRLLTVYERHLKENLWVWLKLILSSTTAKEVCVHHCTHPGHLITVYSRLQWRSSPSINAGNQEHLLPQGCLCQLQLSVRHFNEARQKGALRSCIPLAKPRGKRQDSSKTFLLCLFLCISYRLLCPRQYNDLKICNRQANITQYTGHGCTTYKLF